MLIFGRNLALGRETTDICAIIRPKLHIVRRKYHYVCLNPAEISCWTKKQKIYTLISDRFLAMGGETRGVQYATCFFQILLGHTFFDAFLCIEDDPRKKIQKNNFPSVAGQKTYRIGQICK